MGLTAGNARVPGQCNKCWNRGLPRGPCCPPFSLVLHFVTDSRMFWVFGSLFQRRCGTPLASCCGSGNVHLFRRCGVSSASCCGSGNLSSIYLFWTPAYFLVSDDSPSTRFPDVPAIDNIYRMSQDPHGPRATQPRVSSADANKGQGPHSTGDDPKTGHPNILEDLWWVAGELAVLTWFRSCCLGSGCPSLGFSCFLFCPVTGVCLFLLGRQPEDWPFTGFLHCQRLCESDCVE